ncbi:MAG TPA: putative Ig domain-containing protein [Candidatus Marinimicrobia bacterium]|nr:putative Ig domain-containing protein [Candidatus Neomarinimicrobiota bacterium]HRS52368.1 putative Ig domain-containing protein [Candidatus Neomarinimicrobiota bacterium]HRU92983.1 putative Ig domain-containing protein [Candidatus Neomarinimicrobiota bacterium]
MKSKITFIFVIGLMIVGITNSGLGQPGQPVIFPFNQSHTVLLKTVGGLNCDNDENLDVIGIAGLVDGRGQLVPRSTYLVHLEESANSDFTVQWRFNLPDGIKGDFSDIAVINWNGVPAIIAALSITEAGADPDPAWLMLFEYSDGFSKEPTIRMTTNAVFPVRPRPSYLSVGDLDDDNRPDLVISSSSPDRSVSIVTQAADSGFSTLKLKNYSSDLHVLLGLQPFRALAANVDGKPGDEIVIFGGQQKLEVEVYFSDLKSPTYTYTFTGMNRNDFDLDRIMAGDLDGDGLAEFVLPLRNGGAQLLIKEGKSFKSGLLIPKKNKLSALNLIDINDNGLDEILYACTNSADIYRYEYSPSKNIFDLSTYISYQYSNPVLANVQFLSIAPVVSYGGKNTGAIIVPFLHQNFEQHGLCYWPLEEISPLFEESLVKTVLESVDSVLANKGAGQQEKLYDESLLSEMDLLKKQLGKLTGEEIGLSPLPKGKGESAIASASRKIYHPDILLHPGESMRYNLNIPDLNLDDTKNLSVNIETPPGMKFDLTNKLFTWVPADSQLGLHKVTATISWSGKKELRSFTVYVNSLPKIVTEIPARDIVQIGETFGMQIDVIDENQDAIILYKLLESPAGATINQNGELLWKPSFDQADWYDFIVEISDGYDSEQKTFALFVNHPVSIQSTAPKITTIGKEFTYQPIICDNNKGAYLTGYSLSPRIENWSHTGVLETRILDQNIRNNLTKYIERYRKSFPLSITPAKISDVPKSLFQDVFVDSDKVVFVYNLQTATGMEPNQIIETFFSNLNMSVPKYSTPVRRYLYIFNLNEPIAGLTMTGEGLITWTPADNQFDYQSISYTVSDGFFSAEEHAQVYVNYPPKITSKPPTIAHANALWQYEVKVTDLNTDCKLTYELLNAPEGMVISPQGVISWQPTDLQINAQNFTVKVSDGFAQDIQKVRLFVNAKPKITSVPEPVALTNLKYEYQLKAEDANNDKLTYKAVQLPKNAGFDPATGMIVWTPRKDQIGANDIVLKVTDSHGGSTLQKFQVHVFANPAQRHSFLKFTASLVAIAGVIYLVIIYL